MERLRHQALCCRVKRVLGLRTIDGDSQNTHLVELRQYGVLTHIRSPVRRMRRTLSSVSTQHLQRLLAEGTELLPQAHFARPLRVMEQRASNLDEIELPAREALHQRFEIVGRRRGPIPLRVIVALVETDAAHRHAQLAGEFPGPAGQIERRAFELRAIEVTYTRIEDIDSGI